MSEQNKETRYGELKYRLKSRISESMFGAMPEEVRNFFLEMPQEDIKESFINVATRIPWEAGFAVPEIHLRQAKALLDRSHYAMEDVKEKVMRYLACQKHLGKSFGAVLLLVGAPGVGKTSIAASIAAAMDRPCVKISLAGVSDAYFLRGVHTVYHNARPGRVVEALIRSHSFCPVILLDEIDKMGASQAHGRPEDVLLDLLDSDRSRFVDNFLNIPLDLSNAIFIATANRLDPIAPVLQDRMDIVKLPSYADRDKRKIVQGYVWPKLLREYRLDSLDQLHDSSGDLMVFTESLELGDDAVEELIRRCPEEGVRDLERQCRRLCESVIALYYAEQVLVKRIDAGLLDTLLAPIFYN